MKQHRLRSSLLSETSQIYSRIRQARKGTSDPSERQSLVLGSRDISKPETNKTKTLKSYQEEQEEH